jgi:hypothetical protein
VASSWRRASPFTVRVPEKGQSGTSEGSRSVRSIRLSGQSELHLGAAFKGPRPKLEKVQLIDEAGEGCGYARMRTIVATETMIVNDRCETDEIVTV